MCRGSCAWLVFVVLGATACGSAARNDKAVAAGVVAATAVTLEVIRQAQAKNPNLPSAENCCVICDPCSFPCGDLCVVYGTFCTVPPGCACSDSTVSRRDTHDINKVRFNCPAPGEVRTQPVPAIIVLD